MPKIDRYEFGPDGSIKELIAQLDPSETGYALMTVGDSINGENHPAHSVLYPGYEPAPELDRNKANAIRQLGELVISWWSNEIPYSDPNDVVSLARGTTPDGRCHVRLVAHRAGGGELSITSPDYDEEERIAMDDPGPYDDYDFRV